MLISLQQNEIEEALLSHIGETASGLDLNQYDVSIKLIAGRSGNGLRAEIDLVPKNAASSETVPTPENDAPSPAAEVPDADEPVVDPFDFDE
jgi:hypothetical protein